MLQKILIWALFLSAAEHSYAQTTLKVVTKNIQKTVNWKAGQEVWVNSEKAEIEIAPTNDNTIRIQAELSTKHPNPDSARLDLEAWQFVVSTIGKKIYIRAYIGVTSGKALPTSNFKASLKITLPAACPVNLANKYGKAHLEKLDGAISLSGEFCQFKLEYLKGKVDVNSRYGNVEGRHLSGPLEVQIKRADVFLSGTSNSCNLTSEYGKVTMETSAQTGNVAIVSNKSEVTLVPGPNNQHNFDLKNTYGSLSIQKNLPFVVENPDKNTHLATLKKNGQQREIKVNAVFGQLTIK
jgi:hypothetical protein